MVSEQTETPRRTSAGPSCGCLAPALLRGEAWVCSCGTRWQRLGDGWLNVGAESVGDARASVVDHLREGLAEALGARPDAIEVSMASMAPSTWTNAWPVAVPSGPGVLVVSLADADTSAEVIETIRGELVERLGCEVVVIAGASGVAFVPDPVDPDAPGPLTQDADLP